MSRCKSYTFMMKSGEVYQFNARNLKDATDRLREAVYHAPQVDAHGDTILHDLVVNWVVDECH